MHGCVSYMMLFIVVVCSTHIYAVDQPVPVISPEIPNFGSYFVRGDVIFAKKVWETIRDHNQFIMRGVKKITINYTENLLVNKFANDSEKKQTLLDLQQRNIDAIDAIANLLTEQYNSYGSIGVGKYLEILNQIDEYRRGQYGQCNVDVINKWRNAVLSCSWNGLGRTSKIFKQQSDRLEKIFDNMEVADVTKETDETILMKFENSTLKAERIVNKNTASDKNEFLGMWTSFINCLTSTSDEIKTNGCL